MLPYSSVIFINLPKFFVFFQKYRHAQINKPIYQVNVGREEHAPILLGKSRSEDNVHPTSDLYTWREGVDTWAVFRAEAERKASKGIQQYSICACVRWEVKEARCQGREVHLGRLFAWAEGVQLLQPPNEASVSEPWRRLRRINVLAFPSVSDFRRLHANCRGWG